MVTFYVVILQQRNLCYEYLLLLFFEEIENLITTTMHICAHILKMYMFIISFQAMPYVNGTLYSLLANQQINHEAKKMGLSDILEYYHKVSVLFLQFNILSVIHDSIKMCTDKYRLVIH